MFFNAIELERNSQGYVMVCENAIELELFLRYMAQEVKGKYGDALETVKQDRLLTRKPPQNDKICVYCTPNEFPIISHALKTGRNFWDIHFFGDYDWPDEIKEQFNLRVFISSRDMMLIEDQEDFIKFCNILFESDFKYGYVMPPVFPKSFEDCKVATYDPLIEDICITFIKIELKFWNASLIGMPSVVKIPKKLI